MLVADGCGGSAVPWADLEDALVRADIILSTTGATEPVVTLERWQRVLARRSAMTVILDIAVPRDFDPRIVHDGDRTCLFNVDDLQRIIDQTRLERMRHIGPASAIVEAEQEKFCRDWRRKRNNPTIQRLNAACTVKREAVVKQVLARLGGKLSEEDRKYLEVAFEKLQSQILHGPISALTDEPHDSGTGGGGTLLEALRKLFRLGD